MSGFDDVAQFATVDHSADPGFFIRTLEVARQLSGIVESRAEILAGLRLAPGQSVLEIGSGLGIDSLMLAREVLPGGRVVGVDFSEIMVAEAVRRAEGLDLPVTYGTGDVAKLGFPDGTFDCCRTERVLLYVADPDQALSEMIRVTRPGGRVGVFDVDFGTLVVDHPDEEMTSAVVRLIGAAFPHPTLGRTLRRRFVEHGLTEIEVTSRSLLLTLPVFELILPRILLAAEQRGDYSRDQLSAWWDQLGAAGQAATLTAPLTAFTVSGTKPQDS